MNVVVNDLLTRYEVQGNGQTVLLLHGWGDSMTGLANIQKSLSSHFKVISLDLPGFGATQPPASVWNLDNYAEFIRDFLSKIDEKPFAILGHSNGGALTIRGTALKVLQPEKIVLLASSGIRTTNSGRRTALKVVAKVGNGATIWLPKTTRAKLRRKLYGAAGSDLLVVEHLQETFKQTVRQDVQADATLIKVPTLLIFADQDKAVPLADGEVFQKLIENSKLEVITGAGHFIHLDQPNKVNQLIEEFLT